MTLRSRGIRGHVYEMRNHKLNSPKTRRFAFTNIVSVTKDFQTPRSIIRRPFLILKTIFLVGLSWHIYRVYILRWWFFFDSRMRNLNDITLILCNPKQLQLRRLKWWNTSVIFTNCLPIPRVFGLLPQIIRVFWTCHLLQIQVFRGLDRLIVRSLAVCSLHRPWIPC